VALGFRCIGGGRRIEDSRRHGQRRDAPGRDAGTKNFVFTVTLSETTPQTVTIDYATVGAPPPAPGDFTSLTGTLTFGPNVTVQRVTVVVNGDETVEPDETFFFNLSNPVNSKLNDDQRRGHDLNDDVFPPSIYVGDVSLVQSTSGTRQLVFPVGLSTPSTKTVTVNFATADAPRWPQRLCGPVRAAHVCANTLTQYVTVSINPNVAGELDESFQLVLTNPTRG